MKKMIVTGAAGGIGSAIVERLLAEGVSVIACDRASTSLKELVERLKPQFPEVSVEPEIFDVSIPAEIYKFGETISKKDREICGLVNNAGIYLGRNLLDYPLPEMEMVLSTNLLSAILLSQIVGKFLVEQKRSGVIVNLSSISAFEGSSDALYGTTKAGLLGLTKSCALTFAPWVRVNAVAPGLVDTPLLKAIPQWRLEEFEKGERLKGRITPKAVASAVWFLVSEESKHTTGSVIDLNNGGYFR